MKHLLLTTIAAVLLVGCVMMPSPDHSLFDAIEKRDIEAVKQHIAAGTDVNVRVPVSSGVFATLITGGLLASAGASGPAVGGGASGGGVTTTPLHLSAIRGHKEIVELLIAKGAYVNTTDENGYTTLHKVAYLGQKEVAELLIDKGAYVHAKTTRLGRTPLHLSATRGHKEIVEQLIDKGADVNAKTNSGRTPLHSVAYWGRKEVAALLIGKGADVNAKDDAGITPLGGAIRRKHTETANLLRKHGGKTGEELKAEGKSTEPIAEAATPEPTTAKASDISIHDAAFSGFIEGVKQHLNAGEDVDAKGGWMDGTPLQYATMAGHKEIVELLIADGADVNAKVASGPYQGKTQLDLAIMQGRHETADLLRKHGGKTRLELKAEGK